MPHGSQSPMFAPERLMTTRALLEQRAYGTGERTFLIFAEDGREWSYAAFDRAVNRAAARLEQEGVGAGTTVSILLANCPEFLFAWFATQKLGAIAGVVNTRLKLPELEYIVADAGAHVLVTSRAHQEIATALQQRVPALQRVVWSEQLLWPDDVPAPGHAPRIQDPATIVYTSGTTGQPKGVLLSHANLFANGLAIAHDVELSERDRGLCILPLFHVNATTVTVLAPLLAGASVVLTQGFSASAFLGVLARHRATFFSCVPTVFSILLNRPASELDGLDLGSLRFALCGGAPLAVETLRAFEQRFAMTIIEGYGLTEGTCGAAVNRLHGKRKPGSIGLPVTGVEMAIVDACDRELPPFARGEIVLRGPNVMLGYHRCERETRAALRHGFLHTQDIGYVDDEGFFYIVDRQQELIIRGGENIYPREIEEVLYAHGAVQDAAVVGIADPVWGEAVKAFLVLRPGSACSPDEILAHCRAHLADYKLPASIELLAEMPKNATGKILKQALKR